MIKIEQDGFYLNAMGEILKITIMNSICEDENCDIYNLDGRYIESESGKYDLIGYIPKELHYEILRMINGYHLKGK